mgnify:CR=1 FL=1
MRHHHHHPVKAVIFSPSLAGARESRAPAFFQGGTMSLWYRVFARSESAADPVAMAELAQNIHPGTTCHFGADEAGWFSCEVRLPDGAALNLARSAGRRVWMLADPIEDDPKHPKRVITVRGAGYLFAKAQA